MHPRKRIEIVVEAVRATTVTDLLDRLGATGWTVLPVLAGRGRQGLRRSGGPGGVDDNVMVVCIASTALVEQVVAAQAELLGARPAIVTISDCQVVREGRF